MSASDLKPSEADIRAEDHFKAGRLDEAIAVQTAEVKAHPTDQSRRLFLFELLAFAGDLNRAERQVEALQYGEMERDAAVAIYRRLVDAERSRRQLFTEGLAPQFLLDPPRHVELRLEAVGLWRSGQQAEALAKVREADQASPALRGHLNGTPFELLRDCDDRFGGVLEVLSGTGIYYWVPLEQIATLSIAGAKYPRDLLWLPARLEVQDGPSGDVFLPTLYPGSHEHVDAQIRLGLQTDWSTAEDAPVCGVGQRLFLRDDEALHLLEWRELEMQ